MANEGTIFLDEVGELPLSTQVRLLRVLESGEFMKVGSSEIKKVNVRVVAATNVNIQSAIQEGKFREDLYYRLNTINIKLAPLRERKEDIHLLFRKFAADFADRYHIPAVRLEDEAIEILESYSWPGNIRQLKNTCEQMSAVEQNRIINAQVLSQFIPKENPTPVLYNKTTDNADFSEREILYKVFDMKNDLNELKRVTNELMQDKQNEPPSLDEDFLIPTNENNKNVDTESKTIEIRTLQEQEKLLIQQSLDRHQGKRKETAEELGISERTLYRKIKEYLL